MLARSRFARVSVVLTLALAAACAGPAPTTARIVATEGGRVVAASHEILIPAGSLLADTEVTLVTAPASSYPALPNSLSEVLRIEPEGTVLERAATVTIDGAFIGAAAADSVSVSQLANVDGVMMWRPMESSRDAASGDVAVSVTRFAPLGVVVVRPGATGEIRGTIAWGDASPAAGAPVQLFSGATSLGTSVASETGAFSFPGLAPGEYRLVVDYECRLDRAVTVAAGAPTQVMLTLCGG